VSLLVQIKFAPLSSDKQIPGTDFSIQIGVIQNETRSWGVKLSHGGKVVAAKRIKKLIDVEIVGIIRDTIGKKVALDTFELGSAMSALLREVYDKLQGKQAKPEHQTAKSKTSPPPRPTPAPSPQPQPEEPQTFPEEPVKPLPTLDQIKIPVSQPISKQASDSFWSSYSNIDTEAPITAPTSAFQQPPQPTPTFQPPPHPAPSTASNDLDDALAILGISCPKCGKEVDPDLDTCPYCGAKL